MADYNFDKTYTTAKGGTIKVDTQALYGYWERPDGTEGGGLWFSRTQLKGGDFGPLELVDFDGDTELRPHYVQCLRDAGYIVDEDLDT